MGSALPNKVVALGDKAQVSGIMRNKNNVTVSIEVAISAYGSGPSGKAAVSGLNVKDSSSEWTVTVPSNLRAGTFRPGSVVLLVTTMTDSDGNQLHQDNTQLTVQA